MDETLTSGGFVHPVWGNLPSRATGKTITVSTFEISGDLNIDHNRPVSEGGAPCWADVLADPLEWRGHLREVVSTATSAVVNSSLVGGYPELEIVATENDQHREGNPVPVHALERDAHE